MAGPDRIQDWLMESSLAFSVAADFPFGRTTLHDLTMDEDTDFPFLPKHIASSDSEDEYDEEEEDDMPTAATAASFPGPPPTDGTSTSRRTHDGHSPGERQRGASEKKAQPALAMDQPFLYSGRLVLVALPGLALVVSVAGDLLITILTIGAMMVYLLHVAGLTQKSMIAYILTFGCCQATVIYSALPLLWHTVLNVFLIGILNCFTILTGAWGLVFFNYFRTSEPDLTRVIETCLFGLYPAINVILVTWIIGSGISPVVAPYGLLTIGFMVLQLFMTPTPSSFNKPNLRDTDIVLVLDSNAVGGMALAYTALPPAVYTYLTVVHAHQPLLSSYFLVELVFLGCLSAFLATLMNLREFLEVSGVEYRYLQRARWVFGLTALMLLSGVLHKYGFSFYLLPWLTLGVALHTGHGFFSRHRQYRLKSAAAALVLTSLYAFIFAKLPWKLDLWLAGSGVHINTAQMLLFANALLCIACVYASTNCRTTLLGWLVVIQTVGLVAAEKLLWTGHHYLTSLLVLSAVVAIYAILRLYHGNKLSWQPACLCMAVHLTKLNNVFDATIHRGVPTPDHVLYEDGSTLLLGLIFTRAFIFEKETITFKTWLSYMLGGLFTLTLATPALLHKCFIVIFGMEPTFSDLTAMGLLLAAAMSVKLSLQADSVTGWLGLSHVGPTAVVMSVVLFHLKPEPVLIWEELNKWLVIVNLVSCFFLIPMASHTKSSLLLGLIGVGLGTPLGVIVSAWAVPGEVDTASLALSSVMVTALVCLGLFVWRQVQQLESKIVSLLILVAVSNLGLCITDDGSDDLEVPSHSLIAAAASSTIIALVLKLHAYREHHVDLTASANKVNRLAVIGNIAASTAYILLCACCRTQLWEIWCIITSSVLLLLQRDHLLLSQLSRRNNSAPMLIITSLVLWSSAGVNSSAFWPNGTLVHLLTGIIELLLVCIMVPPLYIVFFTVLWQNRFYISDRIVVFVTPAHAFLFIFGSSFQAWAFGIYGIGVGTWLIKYKLPLKTDINRDATFPTFARNMFGNFNPLLGECITLPWRK